MPKLEPPFKCYIYCTNKKPYLVWGDVFRGGSFENEFTHLSGYNRKAAEEIWDVFNGKVAGEFICDRIEEFTPTEKGVSFKRFSALHDTCLSLAEIREYLGSKVGYGWHISDLVIYDTPKPLWDFMKCGAPTENELDEELCRYCEQTEWGERKCYGTPDGPIMCEGAFCGEAYDLYLDENFVLKRPPQSWCYVEGR